MSHLCTRCKALMCPDCREIAEEYEELLSNWKHANLALEQRIEEKGIELALIEARANDWEKLAKLGYPEMIQRWMDSQVGEAA